MRKHYFYLSLLIVLTSCASNISYIGNSFHPTSKIDVFVDESAIHKNYEIVGKGYVRNIAVAKPERIQTHAINKAREKGADAILLKDYYVPVVTTGLQTSSRRDSAGRIHTTTGNTAIPVATSSEIVVLFLKYKE